MKKETISKLILALGIGLLPPIWAVINPYIGITTGTVALICAGLYVASGNSPKNAFKISISFLMGDLWAFLVVLFTEKLQFNPDLVLYLVLFVLGIVAVILAESFPKIFYTPSWLCGWAVGLSFMAGKPVSELKSLPLQIGVSMIVGVVYVGIGVDLFHKTLMKIFDDKHTKEL